MGERGERGEGERATSEQVRIISRSESESESNGGSGERERVREWRGSKIGRARAKPTGEGARGRGVKGERSGAERGSHARAHGSRALAWDQDGQSARGQRQEVSGRLGEGQ